jgi:hypothetical protein
MSLLLGSMFWSSVFHRNIYPLVGRCLIHFLLPLPSFPSVVQLNHPQSVCHYTIPVFPPYLIKVNLPFPVLQSAARFQNHQKIIEHHEHMTMYSIHHAFHELLPHILILSPTHFFAAVYNKLCRWHTQTRLWSVLYKMSYQTKNNVKEETIQYLLITLYQKVITQKDTCAHAYAHTRPCACTQTQIHTHEWNHIMQCNDKLCSIYFKMETSLSPKFKLTLQISTHSHPQRYYYSLLKFCDHQNGS